jgi:hypothetical protein
MNLQGQGKEETPFSGDSSAKMEGFTHKKPKCFSCGGEHYINNCLEVLEFQKMKEKEVKKVKSSKTISKALLTSITQAGHQARE